MSLYPLLQYLSQGLADSNVYMECTVIRQRHDTRITVNILADKSHTWEYCVKGRRQAICPVPFSGAPSAHTLGFLCALSLLSAYPKSFTGMYQLCNAQRLQMRSSFHIKHISTGWIRATWFQNLRYRSTSRHHRSTTLEQWMVSLSVHSSHSLSTRTLE